MATMNIMDKYKEEILRAKNFLTYGRDPFEKWSQTKITFFAMIMEPKDFYHLLVQSEFINTENVKCNQCKEKMSLYSNPQKPDGCQWECKVSKRLPGEFKKTKCNTSKSARHNSWFYNSHLSTREILLITYMWWYKTPLSVMRREFGFTDRTCCDWASYCREVAIDEVMDHNSEAIGGPGIIVEIDESKFGKSKNKNNKKMKIYK